VLGSCKSSTACVKKMVMMMMMMITLSTLTLKTLKNLRIKITKGAKYYTKQIFTIASLVLRMKYTTHFLLYKMAMASACGR